MANETPEEKPKLYSLRVLQKLLENQGYIIPYRTLLHYIEKGYIVPDYSIAFRRKHRYLFSKEGILRALNMLKQNKIIMENQSWGKFFKVEPRTLATRLYLLNKHIDYLKAEWNKLIQKIQGKPELQPEVANIALILKDLEHDQETIKSYEA